MTLFSSHQKFVNLILVVIIAFGLIAGAFQHFVLTLPSQPDLPPRQIDGIVVATGGQGRISEGLKLLGETGADTMLITGVGTDASKQALATALSIYGDELAQFTCCVELDITAQDTSGNAKAAARWAAENNFQHLLLVTANYHMPRAKLAFLRHPSFTSAHPDIQLSYWPVIPADLKQDSWYASWSQLRLLGREFAKYSLARLHLI